MLQKCGLPCLAIRFTTNFPRPRLIPRLLLPIVCFFNLLAVLVLVPSCVIAKSLSADDMDLVLAAASLSNRVYRWDDIGFDTAFETYYESEDKVDAVVVAVFPKDKRCIIAFRGTKPMRENNVGASRGGGGGGGIVADITTAGIIDLLSNVAFQKETVMSKTNASKSCTVGQPMLQSYYSILHVEDQIDADCVSPGLSLIFTGHSQGAALAQMAAVRYEQQQPAVISFGPASAFFDDDECPIVPDDRILNFVNTETDKNTGILLGRNAAAPVVQFDIIPFLDVFIDKYNIAQSSSFASFWSFLPENVYNAIVQEQKSRLSDFFIGTYKGEFYILNPDELPSLAYVSRRADILLNSRGDDDYSSTAIVDVDLLDLDEMLDFTTTTYGQRFISAHEMNNYQRKLEQLLLLHEDKNPNRVAVVAADGFESFTSCNPKAKWKQCAGFCAENAFLCTTGAQGEPCSSHFDCVEGLSCKWIFEGIFRLAWRCL